MEETKQGHAGNQATYNELGHVVRKLHETFRELGCDESLQKVAGDLPETKDRLHYIVALTEQAANRALNAVETAMPVQEKLASDARRLSDAWRSAATEKEREALHPEVQDFLDNVPNHAQLIGSQLTEILMAQDFQDLTGQVIKKVMDMASDLEQQLVNILLLGRTAEAEAANSGEGSLLNGPVVKKEGRTDIVGNQQEVDDLLDGLGF